LEIHGHSFPDETDMTISETDVLVIGGGISGLSVARLLANTGIRVELWERDNRTGGKIKTETHEGYRLEQSASIVMNFRADVNRFMNECGLDKYKKPLLPTTKRHLIIDDQLCQIPMKLLPMMTSPLWSWQGKLRMALEPFIKKGSDENESAADFIRRRLGSEFLEKAMEPYIAGPLSSDAELANAVSVLPRMTALEQRYGSLLLGMMMHKLSRRRTAMPVESFSFENGMSTLTDRLAQSNKMPNTMGSNITIRNQCEAQQLIQTKDGWRIHGRTDGAEYELLARQVILSTPADAAAVLTHDIDAELSALLSTIDYAPVSVVHTGFDRDAISHPLDGNGFLTPGNGKLVVNGCLWMSNLFSDRAPDGKVLMSNYLGGARRPDAASWDEERCIDNIMHGLKPLLGISQGPEMVHIHRHKQGLPMYNGAYSKRLTAIAGRLQGLPGLHLSANYIGGVSVRDRIACAYELVGLIAPEFRQARQAGKSFNFDFDYIPQADWETGKPG
jgi:protoporphyrinogen/coproporphyrinogen III oxidase